MMNQAQTKEVVKTVLGAKAELNLMTITEYPELLKRLLNKHTLIDAKISFLTCECETITVDVTDILKLDWVSEEIAEFEQ
jgi:hypothetical protein